MLLIYRPCCSVAQTLNFQKVKGNYIPLLLHVRQGFSQHLAPKNPPYLPLSSLRLRSGDFFDRLKPKISPHTFIEQFFYQPKIITGLHRPTQKPYSKTSISHISAILTANQVGVSTCIFSIYECTQYSLCTLVYRYPLYFNLFISNTSSHTAQYMISSFSQSPPVSPSRSPCRPCRRPQVRYR